MTVITRDFPDRVAFSTRAQLADADRWARVALIAAAIPIDVDLSDEGDVIRALYALRFCAADFEDVLDDAIARAADNRLIRP